MKLVLTEETRERELCAQEEVLVRAAQIAAAVGWCTAAVGAVHNGAGTAVERCL